MEEKIVGESELEEPLVRCFEYLLCLLTCLELGDGRRLVYIGMEMCIPMPAMEEFCSDPDDWRKVGDTGVPG